MNRRRPVPSLPSVPLLVVLALSTAPPVEAQSPQEIGQALGSLEWREIGPVNMGGRVSAVVGVAGDPSTFWVGGADGGVWKTVNGGTTFEGQWQDAEAYSVGALAVAPSDRNVVYVGSGEGDPRNSVSYGLGVWRSTDGGASWTPVGLEETERIHRIVVDPRDPDVALVCAMGREWGPNEERGVFRTEDGGATWEHVLFIDEDTGCADMDLDLSNPRNVYAGMWTFRRRPWRFDDGGRETGVYISRDGGRSWSKVETLPDEPMARPGLSVAQSAPNVVYLVTEFPTAGTLFRSDDHGETWAVVNDDRNLNFRPFYYSNVYVDPTDEDVVYTLSGRLSKSEDGGRTFRRIARDVHGDHQSFWIDPADGDHVLSGSDGGFQVSVDGGENFHIWRNVVLSQFYHIFVDDRDPYWVCGGLQDNGNWCGPSRDRGRGIMPDEWYTVSGGDGFYTVPVPGRPWLVYSNAQGGYFRITDTRSGMTRSIEPYPRMMGSQGQSMAQARYRFNWDAPIVISPHDPAVVYWGGNVLFRSDDYGYSWDVISPDLTTDDPEKQRDSGGEIYNDNTAAEFHTTIYAVAESPVEAGVIWVGTDDGNVQLTRDGGESWTNVRDRIPGLPAEAWINHIEPSATDPGAALLVVDNHRMDDFAPYLWETLDYGATWRNLSAALPQDDYAKIVRQHPDNPHLLFLGMERGIQASFDGGGSWIDLRNNLPRVSVRGIAIEPRYGDLVIGTHGRGAWILDDIGPLVALTEAMTSPVHLFEVRTATDWESWNRDTNLGQSGWVGRNPEEGAYLHYWLAEAGEAATVRITDAGGTLVRELADLDAGPGLHRLVWDLRWEGSESGEQGGGSFFGSSGPPAAPGAYTATLSVDGRELSTDFRVRGDPAVETSQADYAARTAAALRARDLRSRLDGMIGALDDLDGQIESLVREMEEREVEGAERVLEVADEARRRIATLLDDELRRPPPNMGYRQYPRLSEEASRLAGSIAGAQARPTEGQLEALADVEAETEEAAAVLGAILDGPVAELNGLLGGQPRLQVDWRVPSRVSLREDGGRP
jgi:photosystem II stability/assembly factor-like uncharacterized protein